MSEPIRDSIDYRDAIRDTLTKRIVQIIAGEAFLQILFAILAISFKWPSILWGLLFIGGVGIGVMAILVYILFHISETNYYLEYSTLYIQGIAEQFIIGEPDESENTKNKPSKK